MKSWEVAKGKAEGIEPLKVDTTEQPPPLWEQRDSSKAIQPQIPSTNHSLFAPTLQSLVARRWRIDGDLRTQSSHVVQRGAGRLHDEFAATSGMPIRNPQVRLSVLAAPGGLLPAGNVALLPTALVRGALALDADDRENDDEQQNDHADEADDDVDQVGTECQA